MRYTNLCYNPKSLHVEPVQTPMMDLQDLLHYLTSYRTNQDKLQLHFRACHKFQKRLVHMSRPSYGLRSSRLSRPSGCLCNGPPSSDRFQYFPHCCNRSLSQRDTHTPIVPRWGGRNQTQYGPEVFLRTTKDQHSQNSASYSSRYCL